MRSSCRTVVLVACLVVLPTHAQSAEEPQASVAPMPVTRDASPAAAPTPDDIVDMDAVVVSGVLPGPRMWRVSKGDNDLYILGTLSPLPKRMEWMSREVEDTIARSQAVIAPHSVAVHSDGGFFRLLDRKDVVEGKSGSVRVDPGWRPLLK